MQLDIIELFSKLLFPVAVAAYLLWERSQTMEKVRTKLVEIQICMMIILNKLELDEEFAKKLAEVNKDKG